MATLVLSAVGASVGASIGGSVLGMSAAVVGRAAGAVAGRMIDQRLMGPGSQVVETGRVERLRLTGASEGAAIAQVFGRMRVPGQVIWSSRFLETRSSRKVGSGKGSAPSTTVNSYSYSISLGVALCEGVIAGIGRIWADGQEISRSSLALSVYHGTEDQLPDMKIAAVEGEENAPSYRGLAYVVIADLDLGPFGNRVPQFTFEVLRPAQDISIGAVAPLNRAVRGVALMPGSGEYALATETVRYDRGIGQAVPANRHSPEGKTDFVLSMEALQQEFPACGSALLVVSWFGDDLRCGQTRIRPKIEQDQVGSEAMPWTVSGLTRLSAQVVPSTDGRPVYGGTPTDQSVVQAIRDLRARGIAAVFYPFMLMEQLQGNDLINPWTGVPGQPVLPWRGRITTSLAPGMPGSPDGTSTARSQVEAFFGTVGPQHFDIGDGEVRYSGPDEWSYRRFILHAAALAKAAGGVDAFCIGSEMCGLTQIRGESHSFPAVEGLIQLAIDVRAILGNDTRIGYAADWSEYFGYAPQDGSNDRYFHLDPLWAHPEIDFVGIDNYMPVSDWRDTLDHADIAWRSIYDIGYLQANIEGGEGFDWYYADDQDRVNQTRRLVTDGQGEAWIWRFKDLRSWWSLPHHERIGGVRQASATQWVPQSKPIWFTEFGCGAVDKGTNQPNKFSDPKSSESELPHFSTGARDDLIQMQYVRAFTDYWSNPAHNPVSAIYGGRMIDMSRAHAWAWDARPYPYFPGLASVWSDADNYMLGHWLNGRSMGRDLAEVVREICTRAGVTGIDTSRLYGYVRGYALTSGEDPRAALQPLMLAHGFDVVERDGVLVFRTRDGRPDLSVDQESLAVHPEQDGDLVLTRAPEAEGAGEVQVTHATADGAYDTRVSSAVYAGESDGSATQSELNMSLTLGEAKRIAERWLSEANVSRETASFALPPSYADVGVGDVIEIAGADGNRLYRIDRIEDFGVRLVEAVRVEPGIYLPTGGYEEGDPLAVPPPGALPFPIFLDLPLLTGNEDPYAPHLAVMADPWGGDVAVYSSVTDSGYAFNRVVESSAVIGRTLTQMVRAEPGLIDRGAALRVDLGSGTLESVGYDQLLNGGNAVAVGDGKGGPWEVFQFQRVDPVEGIPDQFDISLRLRGQRGTDATMPDIWPAGSLVVLIDEAVGQVGMSPSEAWLERHYMIGPADEAVSSSDYQQLLHAADPVGLRPYSPVSLGVAYPADGAHAFTWIRRTRIGGDDWAVAEVPLGEVREAYRVTISANGTTVREVEVTTAAFDYAYADRVSDGTLGGYAVDVAQISDLYGPGPATRMVING